MKQADFEQITKRYGFKRAGEISLIGGLPSFRLTHNSKDSGWVYLWIEVSAEHRFIVYVGKAGKTLQERCQQHSGGFRRSVPGMAHAERFRVGFANSRSYEIFARKSETLVVHGESDISASGLEELAFIKKFQPGWNKQVPNKSSTRM